MTCIISQPYRSSIWHSKCSYYPPRIAAALLGADSETHPVRRKVALQTNDRTMSRETSVTKRVLIIDDQPHVLAALRDIVAAFQHRHAYEITTARSGDDALAILKVERFDLILVDMIMPGIGDPLLRRQGLDLLRRIRDLGVTAPVLMMSGDLDREKEAEALTEGAFGYLHKPFDMRALDCLVAQAIESVDPRGTKEK
jgi:DNA-binding NtrC family response regulator